MRLLADSKDREAWLAARAMLVTASDVARMLCVGYAKTETEREQQRAILRTEKAFGAVDVAHEHMTVARYLEPAVIAYARSELGWKVEHSTGLYVADDCPVLGATVDGVRIDDDGAECDVEVKVTGAPSTEDCSPTGNAMLRDGPPTHWVVQNQAQMAVSGRPRGYILVLHHFDRKMLKVRAFRNERHDGVVARIKSEATLFWEEVEALRGGRVV